MIIVIGFIILIYSSLNYDLTYEQFLASTPQTFGLITVTYNPNQQYQLFRKHLNNYASMDCPPMTQIVIVWNNKESPQAAGFSQSPKWKRPVHFVSTPHNSMDYRYSLPAQSKAQVFFSIDDDIITNCEELKKSFAVWQSNAVGDVAPLMGYGQRSFDFIAKSAKFTYSDQLKGKFFVLTLIGQAWVPRHYFQLYNAQKSWEVKEMRKFVQQNNNCDDIALNYMVNYFYPEFVAIPLDGNVQNKSPKSGRQSTSKTHYKLRNECVQKFTQVLGYNPMRIVNKKQDYSKESRFVSPLKKRIIYEKRKMLEERFVAEGGNQNKQIFTTDQKVQKSDEKIFQQREKIWVQRQKELRQEIIAKNEENKVLEIRLHSQQTNQKPLQQKPLSPQSPQISDQTKNQNLLTAETLPMYSDQSQQSEEYMSYMKVGCLVAFIVGLLIVLQRVTTKNDRNYQNVPIR